MCSRKSAAYRAGGWAGLVSERLQSGKRLCSSGLLCLALQRRSLQIWAEALGERAADNAASVPGRPTGTGGGYVTRPRAAYQHNRTQSTTYTERARWPLTQSAAKLVSNGQNQQFIFNVQPVIYFIYSKIRLRNKTEVKWTNILLVLKRNIKENSGYFRAEKYIDTDSSTHNNSNFIFL